MTLPVECLNPECRTDYTEPIDEWGNSKIGCVIAWPADAIYEYKCKVCGFVFPRAGATDGPRWPTVEDVRRANNLD